MAALLFAVAIAVACVSGLRWLRIAQREHYLGGSVTRFARRWWTLDLRNVAALAVAFTGAVFSMMSGLDWPALVGLGSAAVAPFGLSVRGSTSKLAWTARLKRLAAATAAVWLSWATVSIILDSPGLLLFSLLAVPVLMDLALVLLNPVERRLSDQWVDLAAEKLAAIAPLVVAITGSYGKTTTKEYTKRILSSSRPTVVSPASFNNRMGLARTINEHLTPGTEVFVAEMGTYGPGEIADLCSWIRPNVGVITAIGPVHLERFGSLARTLEAKAEILEHADVAVLNIDDVRLAGLAGQITGKEVVTCSALGADADVSLHPLEGGYSIRIRGAEVARIGPVPLASNLACAVGIGVALDAPLDRLAATLAEADTPQHRQSVFVGSAGFTIIDDTYNSNPAGVQAALRTLAELGTKRRVVVTPGMVELGDRQHDENRRFAAAAARVASEILIVGRTNRRALLEGTEGGPASVIVMPSRHEAVEWVKANLNSGDVVLYENDLPDHYP